MTCWWHSKYLNSKLQTLPAGSISSWRLGAAMSLISLETLSVSKDTEPPLRPEAERAGMNQPNHCASFTTDLFAEPSCRVLINMQEDEFGASGPTRLPGVTRSRHFPNSWAILGSCWPHADVDAAVGCCSVPCPTHPPGGRGHV